MLERNFVKTLEDSLKDHWEQPCFSNFEGANYSYKDVAESIVTFHEIFKKAGISKGDRIAVCGKNSSNWAKSYLATVTYGAVIVPILPDFSSNDMTNILNHSETKLFFSDNSLWKNIDSENLTTLEACCSLEDFNVLMEKNNNYEDIIEKTQTEIKNKYSEGFKKDDLQFDSISNADLAGIIYTSGTTGFSKGVMLSHNSLMANVDYAQENMGLVSGDTLVNFLPLAHCFGCAFDFLFPFATGCHITFLPRITPQLIIKAMAEVRPRMVLSVPLLIEKIYFKQLKPILSKGYAKLPIIKNILHKVMLKKLNQLFGDNFLTIVIGAAAFNPEVESFLTKIGFRFTVGYGMTECGPLVSYMPWNVYKSKSAGKLINHLEAKVINKKEGSGEGELCVRGENVMFGYYKNDEATKEVIDEEGWLHTGDMVVMDENDVITIMGRCKNMLLGAGGQNIYPEEIEAKLGNYDIIEDNLVIDRNGIVTALVYPDHEYAKTLSMTAEIIKEEISKTISLINKELPLYSKVINFEIITEKFEKTPTSKIKRYKYA
ncbi:MAG: AMP-binding protein [Spirochaetales bacterium]|nr:AMP-binding protein [Spirochaetales bacterium]